MGFDGTGCEGELGDVEVVMEVGGVN